VTVESPSKVISVSRTHCMRVVTVKLRPGTWGWFRGTRESNERSVWEAAGKHSV